MDRERRTVPKICIHYHTNTSPAVIGSFRGGKFGSLVSISLSDPILKSRYGGGSAGMKGDYRYRWLQVQVATGTGDYRYRCAEVKRVL